MSLFRLSAGALLLLSVVRMSYAQENPVPDSRIYKHYSQADIGQMNAAKIMKLNYLFRKSFSVPEEYKGMINPDDIDIMLYDKFRDPFNDKSVYLNQSLSETKDNEKSDKYIILKPFVEVSARYKEIDKQVASGNINQPTERPDDYPKFRDTGNPEKDKVAYEEAQQKWLDRQKKKSNNNSGK